MSFKIVLLGADVRQPALDHLNVVDKEKWY